MARIVRLLSTNVFENLAVEEYLLLRETRPTLLFYVNDPAVVIGRTQNPWKEVDLSTAYDKQISIARRRSGGGTVYHDVGNINFSFIGSRADHDKFKYARLVAEAVRDEFSVPALVNERADIVVHSKKVSGAAYRITADRAYHHGTILVNSDLSVLRSILKSPLAQNIEAMGAKSVPASVCNLIDHAPKINVDSVINAISDKLSQRLKTPISKENLRFNAFLDIAEVNQEVRKMSEETWVYGQTPRFTHTISTARGPLRLQMRKGAYVESVDAELLATNSSFDGLTGVKYGGHSLTRAIASLRSSNQKDACTTSLSGFLRNLIPEPQSESRM